MVRRALLLTSLFACTCGLFASTADGASTLSVEQARALVAKKADKVRRQLKSEGADRSKVPGCWRNTERQVSCFFSIYGRDAEDGYSWKCMLRVVVKLRHQPVGGRRFSYKYGHAVCG
jgi:hypothetical protein